ncbi:Rv1355c family protein [Streptomyces sp. 4N509B]|uniref:Rv1355c family protein n=1 Tax=Streptomyces sp. 4N509B TaxID=3457413 RepID=UPI003FD009D5
MTGHQTARPSARADEAYRPRLLDEADPGDARVLAALRAEPGTVFRDLRAELRAEFAGLAAPPELPEGPEADRFVHYPWRRAVLGLPGPLLLRAVRLDRNRDKLTREEQARLARQTVGVVGQSVGHGVAHTLALEGTCGRLVLADFDAMELTNLNRVPGTLFDVGVNKAVVTARRIAELDPYLPVEILSGGVTAENVDAFLAELSIVVEECDSLDVKLAVREGARRHRLPLVMETSDRGLLDVERFDLEPERPPFHGFLGDTTTEQLRGLSTREKAPFVARILDAGGLSARMAASLVEIDHTLSSWPQLGGEVQLGGALVAAAVRRIGLGLPLPSGRTRADVESALDDLASPPGVGTPGVGTPGVGTPGAEPSDGEPSGVGPSAVEPSDADATAAPGGRPEPAAGETGAAGLAAVLACAQRAPSGGNAQPWRLAHDGATVTIALDAGPERTSAMDVGRRGSALAVGAALYNARAAAAAHGLLGGSELLTAGTDAAPESPDRPAPLTAVLRLGSGADPELAADHPALLARHTNRHLGTGQPLASGTLAELADTALAAGARLRAVTARPALEEAATLLAGSDRVRYLTPRTHREMIAELRWPGEDPRTGIELRTLELAPDEAAAVEIGRRADVMARVRAVGGGASLGDYTRDRVLSSSAVVAVTFPVPPPAPGPGAPTPADGPPPPAPAAELLAYAGAGEALQRVWIGAERLGLAVQPVSPVFLFARTPAELHALSPEFTDTLAALQRRFLALLDVPEGEAVALVLRLSHAPAATARSLRLPALPAR